MNTETDTTKSAKNSQSKFLFPLHIIVETYKIPGSPGLFAIDSLTIVFLQKQGGFPEERFC